MYLKDSTGTVNTNFWCSFDLVGGFTELPSGIPDDFVREI